MISDNGDVMFTPAEVKVLFAKEAGKLVFWTASITFIFTYIIFSVMNM